MRSLIAALRNLTLPFGATTGQRIVLDADQGVILVYDVNNDLVGSIAPDDKPGVYLGGISAYDNLSGQVANMDGVQVAFRAWGPTTPAYVADGRIQSDNSGNSVPVVLVLIPPTYHLSGHGAELDLFSAVPDAFGFADGYATLSDSSAGTGRPIDFIISGSVYAADPSNIVPTRESWHALPLSNAWANVGVGFQTAQYRRMPDGNVRVRGSIGSGTANAFGTLPAGYRRDRKSVV